MKNGHPTFGSQWRHHSGRFYTVLGIANIENQDINYPPMIIYVGKNGNLWTKFISNFYATMKEIKA